MVFVGMKAMRVESENYNGEEFVFARKARLINFNPNYIKWLDEKAMLMCLDDNRLYRIDEESLLAFLNAAYPEEKK